MPKRYGARYARPRSGRRSVPEERPVYEAGTRPLTPGEAAFRDWMRGEGSALIARLAYAAEEATAGQAAEVLATFAASAFAAGWEAAGGEVSA